MKLRNTEQEPSLFGAACTSKEVWVSSLDFIQSSIRGDLYSFLVFWCTHSLMDVEVVERSSFRFPEGGMVHGAGRWTCTCQLQKELLSKMTRRTASMHAWLLSITIS